MENIFLAIVTDDKEYGRSLSLGMLNVCRSFIIRIFSAEEFLSENRDFDMVLWDGEEAKEAYGGRIVYLAEKPSDVVRSIADKRFCIYKYSTASCMISSIFEIYEVLTGRRAVNLRSQDVRLFAFSAFSGGTGCTTLAMSVAQELCRFHGKRVFYMSFEEVDSVGAYIRCDPGIKGAAVYLYELFNKMNRSMTTGKVREEKCPFLEGRVVRDDYGTEAFAPASGRNPLREVNPEEVYKLMASIVNSGRYDVIIMDMGQWLSRTGIKCLEMAEKICLISSGSEMKSRESQYVTHMMSHCGEDIFNKVIKVKNRCDDGEEKNSKESKRLDKEYFIVAGGKNFANEDGVIKIVLEGEYGSDINTLTKLLTEPA